MNTQQPVIVEIDIGSASTRGRPPDHHWMIRIRRGDKSVIVNIGLTKIAAEHLADHIADVIGDDDRAEKEETPLA